MYKTRIAAMIIAGLVLLITQASAQVTIRPRISSVVNDLLAFEPLESTYRISDAAGCPSGFAGKFSFEARLTNNKSDAALSDLVVEVQNLTNWNLLQNADGGPKGVGARLTIGVLGPSDVAPGTKDFVDTTFRICLKRLQSFTLRVKVLANAVPALLDFSPDRIKDFVRDNAINSPQALLERLPLEFKQHWIMITQQESTQKSTATEPRLLLPSRDSSRVFGFCSGQPCNVEYLQFEGSPGPRQNTFRFADIAFPAGKPAIVTIDPPGCRNCHLAQPRPNWDAYDNWANMLPFNRDRLYEGSEEEKAFKRLLEHLRDDPIIQQLKLPDGVTRDRDTELITITPDNCDPFPMGAPPSCVPPPPKKIAYIEQGGLPKYTGCNPDLDVNCKSVPVTQGGRYLTLHHSGRPASDEGRGVALFDQLSGYNAKRVAQELVGFLGDPKVNPRRVDIRRVALAIARGDCKVEKDLSQWASAKAQMAFLAFHGVNSFAKLLTKTQEARHSLPQRKANLQAQNMRDLIRAQDLDPILPTPDNITREIARRSPEEFDVDRITKFMIDREAHNCPDCVPPRIGEDETIALFRFFLEPWRKVSGLPGLALEWVQTWSMGVRDRALTYTFADVFSANITPTYRQEIIDRLTGALKGEGKPVDCPNLAQAQLKEFDRALPLP